MSAIIPIDLNKLAISISERDQVECPHCAKPINMADGERLQGHVSYYGDDEPTSLDCPHCEAEVFLQEHVSRWWTAGKTADEASDA